MSKGNLDASGDIELLPGHPLGTSGGVSRREYQWLRKVLAAALKQQDQKRALLVSSRRKNIAYNREIELNVPSLYPLPTEKREDNGKAQAEARRTVLRRS